MSTDWKNAELTLFYDGACPLCSREAAIYRRRAGEDVPLAFVDIMAPDFDAKTFGLDPEAVHRTIHARRKNGDILTGIDTFGAVWSMLPGYRPLAWLTRTPVIRQVMQVGYSVFARIRPRLPGRKCDACATQRGAKG